MSDSDGGISVSKARVVLRWENHPKVIAARSNGATPEQLYTIAKSLDMIEADRPKETASSILLQILLMPLIWVDDFLSRR